MTDFNGTRGHFVTWGGRPHWTFRDVFTDHANTNSDDWYMLGAGNDKVVAGSGVDHIYAGTGIDEIWAGAGDDVIMSWNRNGGVLTQGWGEDEVHGGAGNDTIRWDFTTDAVTVYGDDAPFTDASTGIAGSDNITTGSGDDFIDAGGGFKDIIEAGAGKDIVFGGDGIDIIDGGAGNDKLHGDAGNDVITGGLGADQLWGGSGADTFVVNQGRGGFGSESGSTWEGADVIRDFNASTNSHDVWDKLDLPGQATASNFSVQTMKFDSSTSWEEAFNQAKGIAAIDMAMSFGAHKYVFVTDGEDGWLFAETGSAHRGIDIAIELRDVTDLSHLNLV